MQQDMIEEIDVSGLKKLGSGVTASVYQLDDERIVKVYLPSCSRESVEKEWRLAKNLFSAGLKTPEPFGLVRSGDSLGCVFQLMQGPTLLEFFQENTSKGYELGEKFGLLARDLHGKKIEADLPKAFDMFTEGYSLTRDMYDDKTAEWINKQIAVMPKADCLLHGDMQPGNVMMHNGEVYFIDVMTVSYGHPLIDILQPYAFSLMWPEMKEACLNMTEEEKKALPLWHKYLQRYEKKALPGDVGEKIWQGFLRGYFGQVSDGFLSDVTELVHTYNYIKFSLAGYMKDVFPEEVRLNLQRWSLSHLDMRKDVFCDWQEKWNLE